MNCRWMIETIRLLPIMTAFFLATMPGALLSGDKPKQAEGFPVDGPTVFRNYCAVCHGEDAKGNGPMASSLKSPVPDLTHLAKNNGGKFPADRVRRIISSEDIVIPAHGTREMPVWGPIFGPWDQDRGKARIDNLVMYIESLQKK